MKEDKLTKELRRILLGSTEKGLINHFFKDSGALSGWAKLKARLGITVYLCRFQPKGYSGEEAFYLFKCEKCKQLSIDHRHSKGRLRCHHCNPPKSTEEILGLVRKECGPTAFGC
jgi:hypothetical protein